MVFVRKTDGSNPFVYHFASDKGKDKVAAPPAPVPVSKKVAVSKKDADASTSGGKGKGTRMPVKTDSARTVVGKIQKRIMKKLTIERIKVHLKDWMGCGDEEWGDEEWKDMEWANTKDKAQLSYSLALQLVHDTEEGEEEEE
eukprot:4361972-Prymnesium_polylepis.1